MHVAGALWGNSGIGNWEMLHGADGQFCVVRRSSLMWEVAR